MTNSVERAMAIVGVGAILPDAPNAKAFWENIKQGRDSISEVSPDRWDPALFYDADPSAPDKTYSKIGGWVREAQWEPVKWRLPIPPRVAGAMDWAQKWAVACTREALDDYGYPQRPLPLERTGVILGNAMGGEQQFFTVLRAYFPEYARELEQAPAFASLPENVRRAVLDELRVRVKKHFPDITEDTMPGELSNCIAGRIANLFNFRGPNFTADAACASAMAAITAAAEGLAQHDFDVAITGGIDRNMGASTFIKFSKIGALSASGSRPYADGADGFVMGEGGAMFVMKRLADAERDGDKIYAVLRAMGGSSDGKGKGITAPNPVGQKLSVSRAWENAGLSPDTAGLFEGHGTSTKVGDVVEIESLAEVLGPFHLPPHSVALGSVKSNIGHLKSAAGAAGILKATLAIHEKVLPPSIHCERPNPGIDFTRSPLFVNTSLKEWKSQPGVPRRAGVSAFGFGGTNFHAVLEEHIPNMLTGNGKRSVAVPEMPPAPEVTFMSGSHSSRTPENSAKAPLRGALLVGAATESELAERLRAIHAEAAAGRAPARFVPLESDLRARERIAIDFADAADLAEKAGRALKAFDANQPAMWKALRGRGIFRGHGAAAKVAFLYTGQGSQYVNMLQPLRAVEPIVAETFAEADKVMKPLLGKPLTDYIFVDKADNGALAKAEDDLRQTAITQPAVLATDIALTRLLGAYGIVPDMTMGHSLGEYGALVAAGALPFADALEAVSARGREMTRVAVADNGRMAAVFAPLAQTEEILKTVDGYVVIANINSEKQAVIGGTSKAVEAAIAAFQNAGVHVIPLPVSHAFHTSIVAPASEPLRNVLERLHLRVPVVPVIANVTGEFYPMGQGDEPRMLDILARQVASPVQFVKGLLTLYNSGVRIFVETGPKRALQGFVDDVLGEQEDVISLSTNHPKNDVAAFNQALCGLYAAGLGRGRKDEAVATKTRAAADFASAPIASSEPSAPPASEELYRTLGRMFADVLERGWQLYGREKQPAREPVAITGAALGLPGTEHIFDDANVGRILNGEQFIDAIPAEFRQAMLNKNVTRLVKSENGGPTFESIHDLAEVIKLAGRGRAFDLQSEFGVSAERLAALDRVTQLAIAAGIGALRDAGIPLIMRYKTTTKGTQLPERWMLPESLRDTTGVIFASAFPGYNSLAQEFKGYYTDRARREQLASLEALLATASQNNGHSPVTRELERRIAELRADIEKNAYVFDRRFLFRVLSMGHSQFAEYIGARGPNTQVNAACASTTQAVGLAEDWIRAGRCTRVLVISADDVTSDHMLEWIGAGFLASGAAATDEVVEDAAIPFDRRRHGMLIGMGAAAVVVESAEAARERGIQPICEVLAAATANSAFHGTRLDVQHIGEVMERLISQAERTAGIDRKQIAPQTVFVSHETYTPARGGSASAEIFALRRVFGDAADQIVIANTKGFTGHPMATGIEDVVAVKALETGIVPPVANFREVDPELGRLNLSKGGAYPVRYALRLAAGFGSQISMTLLRWVPTKDGMRRGADELGYSYRIADPKAWDAWLTGIAGHPDAEVEVVKSTLRVRDRKTAAHPSGPNPEARPTVASPKPAAAPVMVAATVTTRAAVAEAAPPKSVPVAERPESVAPPLVPQAVVPAPKATSEAPDVKARILQIVSDKTGYPTDMLDLDLDLEADLGVDTVKQAEVFAAVRESYGIPRDENLKLRDFPTLAHVIRFVHDRRPELNAPVGSPATVPTDTTAVPVVEKNEEAPVAVPSVAAAPASAAAVIAREAITEAVLAIVVEKTGYPKDMLDLDLDLEADLGVDTVKQAEMFAAIRERYHIPRDENRKLRDYPTLAHVIRFVEENLPAMKTAAQSPTAAPAPSTTVVAKPATIPPVSATKIASDEEVKEKILEIVAEKTGYPKDMLDLDLDLEADLGIDTVKQAEMFAAVRAAYNIPRDENLKLRDFPTLAHVIRFALESRGGSSVPAPVAIATTTETTTAPAPAPRPQPTSFEAAERIPRRVPVPVLRPAIKLCKTSGVSLDAGKRVVVMPDRAGVADALITSLKQRGVEVLRIEKSEAADLTNALQKWLAAGPVHGVFWLPALDWEGDLNQMDLTGWRSALQMRVKALYTTMRALYEHIAKPGTFLVSATRLGGQHGYDASGALAPMGGAVTGFTKTYRRERPEAHVKSVDFDAAASPAEIAERLIDETLRDPGAVEIGYQGGERWTIALEEQPVVDGRPGLTLGPDMVFLVTGAAGSIVSAITADLAAASGATFYLLDVVPEPDPNNPDLARFLSDKDGLKRDIFARIQASGTRATPALVEKELAALERAHAANAAIQAARVAGGTAHYFAVDLTDAEAVASVIAEVRRRSGRIDVLLHAAGMERSHFLHDKQPGEFDLVFNVKADGWFNLLRAIGDMPLGATVAFSSIAGRFGNGGQTDYSSANDLLCKITSSFRTTRPATRAIAIDWTAWGGIGMATRGSIPKMMEVAGIDMLPPEAGIPWVRRELTEGDTRGEVLVGQRLGVLLNDPDPTGGLDLETVANAAGPMIGKIASATQRGIAIETTLDPKVQPFLFDHQIEGTPVLPGVMGIEAFAEAASCLLPGWHVESLEEIDFLAPFKYYRSEKRALALEAFITGNAEALRAECRLIGRRDLPGQPEPQITTHFRGRVRLARRPATPVATIAPIEIDGSVVETPEIYRVYFHGPAYQVIERAWWDGQRMVGRLRPNLPPNHVPAERASVLDPRLIELCFQTAGLWELGVDGRFGLPQHVREIKILGDPRQAQGRIYAVVTPDPEQGAFDAEIVDSNGHRFLDVIGYRTVAIPGTVDASSLKALQAIMADECEVEPV